MVVRTTVRRVSRATSTGESRDYGEQRGERGNGMVAVKARMAAHRTRRREFEQCRVTSVRRSSADDQGVTACLVMECPSRSQRIARCRAVPTLRAELEACARPADSALAVSRSASSGWNPQDTLCCRRRR